MSDKTANEDRAIVSKGTDHVAFNTAPDMCIVPGAGPMPFPNVVKSEKLAAGATTKTLANTLPIMTSASELGPPSAPEHAGTGGGVTSGTYICEAKATSWSKDVFAEGNPVVRSFDTTTQNHGNTVGMVVPEAYFLALKDLFGIDTECLLAAASTGTPTVASGG
jgi:hypothetical protein